MSPEPQSPSRPSPSLYLAVALIAAAVLGYEVTLTRVFAVLLRYQFAFLVISLALCGLGLGGLWAHKRRNLDLANTAAFFGVSTCLSLLLILRGVFAIRPDQFWIAALLVLIPFSAGGAFLAAAFSRNSLYGGQLYAYDLAGAALAAMGSVFVMQWMGAIQACLVFAILGAAAGVMVARKPVVPLVVTAILVLLLPLNARFQWLKVPDVPPMTIKVGDEVADLADRGVTQPLFTELGDQNEKVAAALKKNPKLKIPPDSLVYIRDTRWNAFARTDVVHDPVLPDSYFVYTNGNVPTNMMKWDGKLWTIPPIVANFPLSDWSFRNSNLQGQDVLSIGPGGGLDALLALRYGAKRFDGAEINPGIVGLMNEPFYKAYNGGIYSRPEVHVRTAEGRAFVREAVAHGQHYRLVFSALTKTATAGQGTALLESFIYTSDAMNDYVNALDDDGQVVIVGDAPRILGRLFATAVGHFKAQGLNERQAGTHLAAVYFPQPGPYQWALIVKKKAFTPSQTAQMTGDAGKVGLIPLWIPGHGGTDELNKIKLGSLGEGIISLDAFIAAARAPYEQTGPDGKTTALPGVNFAPCPDDRPFVLDLGLSPFEIFTTSASISILLGLSVLATFGFAAFLLINREAGAGARSTIYFLALGVGFMLVEIPLIQKLILPLGYPTLSLTVILFSLLLGGGAGAAWSQRYEGEALRVHAQKCAVGVATGAVLLGFLSNALSNAMLTMPLPMRCVLAAVLLMPLGFLLGTPFPSGLRLFTKDRGEIVPLIWALNGTASVAGSIAAAVLAKQFGFSAVLGVGALIYLGAAGLLGTAKE